MPTVMTTMDPEAQILRLSSVLRWALSCSCFSFSYWLSVSEDGENSSTYEYQVTQIMRKGHWTGCKKARLFRSRMIRYSLSLVAKGESRNRVGEDFKLSIPFCPGWFVSGKRAIPSVLSPFTHWMFSDQTFHDSDTGNTAKIRDSRSLSSKDYQ